jgi:predicted TIM-barrel fold metal-dependent hydrolase
MFLKYPVIDVHGHLSSPPTVRAYAFNLSLVNNVDDRLMLSDEQVKPAMDRHLRLLDARNIDIQLLSARPIAMMHHESPRIVRSWTQTTNDLIAQQVRLRPERFIGVAQLPQNVELDTANCIEELELRAEQGFVAATVNPDPGADRRAPGLNDAYWHPLYKRAQALEMTLIIHPSITHDRRLHPIVSAYQYNNLTEETLATLLLENTDVFAQFPRLKVLVCHCGGALHRLAQKGHPTDAVARAKGANNLYVDTGEFAGGQLGMPVQPSHKESRDLSNNLFFDTCAYDPHFLSAAIRQRGVHRMAFGTEVPGTSSDVLNPNTQRPADDVLALLRSFAFLDEADVLNLVYHNPLRMFPRLKLPQGLGVAGLCSHG